MRSASVVIGLQNIADSVIPRSHPMRSGTVRRFFARVAYPYQPQISWTFDGRKAHGGVFLLNTTDRLITHHNVKGRVAIRLPRDQEEALRVSRHCRSPPR